MTYLFGLPFLKSEEVGECFALDFVEVQPNNEAVVKFADYLGDYYIHKKCCFSSEAKTSTEQSTNRYINHSIISQFMHFQRFLIIFKLLRTFEFKVYLKLDQYAIRLFNLDRIDFKLNYQIIVINSSAELNLCLILKKFNTVLSAFHFRFHFFKNSVYVCKYFHYTHI